MKTTRIGGLMIAALLACAVGGCASVQDSNSVAFVGPICSVMKAPLAGDFSKCNDDESLKKGESTEVLFFQYYFPIASVGDESLKSAMRQGGITDLYYADYSVRFFLIVGWYTITAYGR